MAFEPNEEQKLFLASTHCNVLVSASAGSGKTSTMIQKLIQILTQEKVAIQKLLVLTFTDATASEIKQKLFTAITEEIEKADIDKRSFLKSQLDNINSAEIGTLHSVCKKLIIKYFYEINQSPDFKLLSERESKYLVDIAMNNVFENYIGKKDESFFELYDCYNLKRNDVNLKKVLLSLFNYLRNKNDYKNWLESTISSSFNVNLNKNKCCEFIYKYTLNQLSGYVGELDKLIKLSQNNNYDKYTEFLFQKKQTLDEILNAKDFIQLQKILYNIPLIKKPRKSGKCDEMELEFDEIVDNFNKYLSDGIKSIKEIFVFDNAQDTILGIEKSKKNVLKIVSLLEDIWKEYDRLKNNRNCLDFNDLEDKMLELLCKDNIVNILKENYQYVFFDEYQDINEKQELILSKLVSEDNYFMIGDVKQSIYAFRQSSPKIFVSKFYKFNNDGIKNKVINFNRNYRSDINILEFNNAIFDELITEKTIGINYKDNSRFQSDKDFKECNVEMKIIDDGVSEDEENEDIDLEEKECLLIADTISNLLTQKKSDGQYFTYRDIAIILRKRGTFVKTLCDTLSAMQIPINATISSEFFNTFEINLMMAICQVIINYKEDISLAIVLKWLFNLSDEDLMIIKQTIKEKYFYDCVKNYKREDEISKKINAFYEFLNNSKMYLSNHTTYEFLKNTINSFDILNILKSMKGGVEKVQNVNEFLKMADNDNYKYNMDKFVEYLQFVSSDSQLQSVGTGGNSIQIMTIHNSKGLEFPAVILSGLGKKFNINKDTNDIIINENFGFGLKSIDSDERTLNETIVRNACKIDNKRGEMNEEIRLLYVAMTRPKEKLFLIGTYNLDNIEKTKRKDIYSSKCYFDLIFKAVPDVYNSYFLNRKNFIFDEDKNSCCKINFVKKEDIINQSLKESDSVIIGDCDEKVLRNLDDAIKRKINTEIFTIKNTVTNILNEEKDYENLNNNPKNLDMSDRVENIDALKLGTAYHSVMQNLKFTENREEIQDLINDLQSRNEISKEYASLINIDEIYNALECLKDYILDSDIVYREKQFVMQENYNKIVKNSDNNTKIIIQGVIDLVIVKNGIAYLIDYKTNRVKDENYLRNKYALQLSIYSHAFGKATGIEINKKYLYSFGMGKLIEVI